MVLRTDGEGWDVVARAHVRAFATSSAPRSRFVFKHYQMVDAIIRNLEVCGFLCLFFLGYDKRINMYCLWFQIMQ